MPSVVYVDGEFVPEEDARVSVFDRGFLLADAVYEVIAVLDGRMIDDQAHLARLARSAGELSLRLPVSLQGIEAVQRELIDRNGLDEGAVYVQVTRGSAERDLAFPTAPRPTVVAFTIRKRLIGNPLAERGLSVMLYPDQRWALRDIKTTQLLASSLARQAAIAGGKDDAWLIEDGFITEGASSNAWIVTHGGVIVTHNLGRELISGITRRAVLAFAETHDIEVFERPFSVEEAYHAAEAFSTSSTTFVMPVVSIDDRIIGDGLPGPMTRRLRTAYIDLVRS